MVQPQAATSLSLALRGGPPLTVDTPPRGMRAVAIAGAALATGLVCFVRKRHADGLRRRIIRRLDRIAPRTRYTTEKQEQGLIINGDCPVCLCEFAKMNDRPIRILECRHALCAECVEAWAVHCTKAHLNPSRFGITRNGRVVSWTPGPKCPLCCDQLDCVPREDLREAVIAAINQRGAALSTIIAYQARSSSTAIGEASIPDYDAFSAGADNDFRAHPSTVVNIR